MGIFRINPQTIQIDSSSSIASLMVSGSCGMRSKKSCAERRTSLEPMMYLPTTIISALLSRALSTRSGVTPPATATSLPSPRISLIWFILPHSVTSASFSPLSACLVSRSTFLWSKTISGLCSST